jgi:hypothetical protein
MNIIRSYLADKYAEPGLGLLKNKHQGFFGCASALG